jgi:DNA-binding MarR family transcriptional regulator
VAGKLQDEIKQTKPFARAEEEVYLNLQRTAEVLGRRLAEALKPAELTPTQYNVLRILRGAGPGGLPCRELSSRMVTHDPDVTRLLDRMESRSLVARSRDGRDRRVIFATITPVGAELLEQTDRAVEDALARGLAHLGDKRLRQLNELLEAARSGE